MKALAIIPARSGSEGLPDKNIRLLNGKPLMVYSIRAAAESGLFDEIMVSTDSEKYAEIARQYGAEVPFLRSRENSGDYADSWAAVREVLENYAERGRYFDSVCLLQPTSPLRTADDIIRAYQDLDRKNAGAITSVCEVDHSPLLTMELPADQSLGPFREVFQARPRQMMNKFYRLNGAVYIRRVTYRDRTVLVREDDEYAFIMDRRSSVDIDSPEDFAYAEFLLNRAPF